MTSYVEQDRQPRRIQWRLALGAIAGILALGIVWLPSHEGTALLVLKVACTLALWGFVLTELAVTGHRVRQARAAERRAEHTRRVLAEALEALPQAVAIFDPTDRPVLVNQRFDELQGPLSHAADAGPGGNPAGESETSLPDGRWVRIDEHRTRNGYRVTVSSDVTEFKRQKAELARRSHLLEAILGAAERGVSIWGPDGRLSLWNGQVARLLDLPAELLTAGRSFAEFEAFLKARGEAALSGTGAGAATSNEPGQVSWARVRYEHARPDGHVLDVIHTTLPDGGWMISYGDITAYRRVERDLREGQERFRRLSLATKEGVLVHNGNVIIDANDAALTLLGRTLAELVGRSAEHLIEPADYAALRHTFECGKTQHREAWFLRSDGSRFLCEVSQRLIPYCGRSAGILTFHDITGYRWIEEQLHGARQRAEAESRASSGLLAVMGQGLRAPLGGILETIRRLSESRLTDEQRGGLQAIRKLVEGIIGTLGDVQDLARIEGDGQRADDAFDLIDLVESVIGPLSVLATAKGIDLVSSVAAGVPPRRARRCRGAAPGTHLVDRQRREIHPSGRRLAEPDRIPDGRCRRYGGRRRQYGAAFRGRGYGHRNQSGGSYPHPERRCRQWHEPRHRQAAGRTDGRPHRL
jgi:two-component system sensor histidine kinase/response regulator